MACRPPPQAQALYQEIIRVNLLVARGPYSPIALALGVVSHLQGTGRPRQQSEANLGRFGVKVQGT
jgi:hypothetical protein